MKTPLTLARKIIEENIVEHFEGCKLKAYQDSVGVWTIGWGHTKDVHSGMVITQAQADAFLVQELTSFDSQVGSLVKVPINDNQLGALVSFTYNLGEGALQGSTLLKKLNAGDSKVDVAQEFLKWDHAGGHVLAGLLVRRQAERALFLKPVVVSAVA